MLAAPLKTNVLRSADLQNVYPVKPLRPGVKCHPRKRNGQQPRRNAQGWVGRHLRYAENQPKEKRGSELTKKRSSKRNTPLYRQPIYIPFNYIHRIYINAIPSARNKQRSCYDAYRNPSRINRTCSQHNNWRKARCFVYRSCNGGADLARSFKNRLLLLIFLVIQSRNRHGALTLCHKTSLGIVLGLASILLFLYIVAKKRQLKIYIFHL